MVKARHLHPFGTSGAPRKKVHSSPVGSLDIFDIHQEEILGITDTTPALWATRFNTWEQSSDPEEAAHLFSVKARAKRLQTPSKARRPQIDFSEFFQSMAPTKLMGDSLDDHMRMYESLWRKTSDEKDGKLLPSNFDFGEHIVENHRRLGHMSGIMALLTEEQGADRRWTERELQGSALRITDLEKIVGEPVGDSASIWTSISTLSSGIRHVEDKITANLNTKVEAIESELDAMLEVMEEMRNGMMEESKAIGRRMNDVAAEQAGGTSARALEEMIKSLAVDKEAA